MRLRYSPRARADIDQILEYISQHSRSGATAVARHIRAAAELLARYPSLGRQTSVPDIRVFPVNPYPFLLYHRASSNELIILHVRHASRASLAEEDLKRWSD